MATWTITVHEVFSHRIGVDIYASFSVQVSPATTVDELIEVIQKCPEKEDRTKITTQMLEPFNPAKIGTYDSNYKVLSENPDATPNCTWDPAPSKTISEAGLCDGAVLSYGTRRICD